MSPAQTDLNFSDQIVIRINVLVSFMFMWNHHRILLRRGCWHFKVKHLISPEKLVLSNPPQLRQRNTLDLDAVSSRLIQMKKSNISSLTPGVTLMLLSDVHRRGRCQLGKEPMPFSMYCKQKLRDFCSRIKQCVPPPALQRRPPPSSERINIVLLLWTRLTRAISCCVHHMWRAKSRECPNI